MRRFEAVGAAFLEDLQIVGLVFNLGAQALIDAKANDERDTKRSSVG